MRLKEERRKRIQSGRNTNMNKDDLRCLVINKGLRCASVHREAVTSSRVTIVIRRSCSSDEDHCKSHYIRLFWPSTEGDSTRMLRKLSKAMI